MGWFTKKEPDGFPYGTPAYDATIHPANAAALSVASDRVQQARDIHLFGSKSAAADVYSHYRDGSPSPTIVAMMGLAAQRDLIASVVAQTWELPFPGVAMDATPSFQRAPDTAAGVGAMGAHGHHAHMVEPHLVTRRRFGG